MLPWEGRAAAASIAICGHLAPGCLLPCRRSSSSSLYARCCGLVGWLGGASEQLGLGSGSLSCLIVPSLLPTPVPLQLPPRQVRTVSPLCCAAACGAALLLPPTPLLQLLCMLSNPPLPLLQR